MEEVEKAVFSCAPEKAPGPDGLPMLFYHRFWSILKDDILDVFNSLYCGLPNLRGINTSWICPVPKKISSSSARDLRPISLVHSLSKIISKVLASRLQLFMDQLINPYQAAFIKGRYILDNFFCAHALIHHLQLAKQPAVLFKIDFERAFDQVNWTFLLDLLQARGFSDVWIGWISSMLHSSSTAVILNRAPGTSFSLNRGLRQGDPLSPLLFVLCIDALFRLLQRAVSAQSIQTVGVGEVHIHSLQFADDVLLFFDGSTRSAAAIKVILNAFSDASGLTINFNKSSIIPIHLPSDWGGRGLGVGWGESGYDWGREDKRADLKETLGRTRAPLEWRARGKGCSGRWWPAGKETLVLLGGTPRGPLGGYWGGVLLGGIPRGPLRGYWGRAGRRTWDPPPWW